VQINHIIDSNKHSSKPTS